MATWSYSKMPELGAFNPAGSWRLAFSGSGKNTGKVDSETHRLIALFGVGDTVNHTLDAKLKDGTVFRLDATKVHVCWPKGAPDHYHPRVLNITAKAASSAETKEPPSRAKKKR